MIAKNEFRIVGDVVWIKLTQGKEACVDLADWEKVAPYRWYAVKSRHMFYAQAMMPGQPRKILKLHRFLCAGEVIDHRDRDGLNNLQQNLRAASSQENARNASKRKSVCSSIFKGVTQNKRDPGWYAHVRVNRKLQYIGYFKTEQEAARAYDERAKLLFKEFAVLNFPATETASTLQAA